MDKKQLIEDAIQTFGVARQYQQFYEEMGELMVAVSHFRRNKCTIEDLMVEIADVRQMIMAIEHLFRIDPIKQQEIEDQQWNKLKEQIENHEKTENEDYSVNNLK